MSNTSSDTVKDQEAASEYFDSLPRFVQLSQNHQVLTITRPFVHNTGHQLQDYVHAHESDQVSFEASRAIDVNSADGERELMQLYIILMSHQAPINRTICFTDCDGKRGYMKVFERTRCNVCRKLPKGETFQFMCLRCWIPTGCTNCGEKTKHDDPDYCQQTQDKMDGYFQYLQPIMKK